MATTHNHQPSFISEKHEMKREKIKLTYATRACTMEEVIRSRNMTLKGSNNDDIGPNGPIGINASSGDRSHANLGWCDKLVDEDSYDKNEDCGLGSIDYGLGEEYALSDDDDEDINSIHSRHD
ncbi:hypothetical protein V6N13_048171 [Hibiscus sabdariffa]